MKQVYPMKFFASANIKIQGVKTVQNSEQTIKNLHYVMLINLFSWSFRKKEIISKLNSIFLKLFLYNDSVFFTS